MYGKKIHGLLILCVLSCEVSAQDFDKTFEDFDKRFEDFQKKADTQYESFRDKCNARYADFLEKSWNSFKALAPIERPQKQQNLPIAVLEQMRQPDSVLPEVKLKSADAGINFRGLVVDVKKFIRRNVVEPLVERRIAREQAMQKKRDDLATWKKKEKIEDVFTEDDTNLTSNVVSFVFYGTDMAVETYDLKTRLNVRNAEPKIVADAWRLCSDNRYTPMIQDCLDLKEKHKLCDWAYLLMLEALSNTMFGKNCNEGTFLMAYIYSQSGFSVRLGLSGNQLLMLYSSDHIIYDKPRWSFDNAVFYIFGEGANSLNSIRICDKGVSDREQPASLLIPEEPVLANASSKVRIIESDKYPEIRMEVCINENLIDFFDTYPTSCLDYNSMTRWAIYANTPLAEDVKSQIYPKLREALKDLSEEEQVRRLLSLLQPRSYRKPDTSLEYAYDIDIWGGDRAFFSEETLFYPYSDCEDHAILFSRLVRDLTGLQVVLVYYSDPCPAHLATAVRFSRPLSGQNQDRLILENGDVFYICDPTNYIPEPGVTMKGMDNSKAEIILLDS